MRVDLRGSKLSALAALLFGALVSIASWSNAPLFKRIDLVNGRGRALYSLSWSAV